MMNNYDIDSKIMHICKNEYKYFLMKAYVVGVGLGCKVKNGIKTNIKCIKVFVSKKVPLGYLDKKNLVSPIYKGDITDVSQSSILEGYHLRNRIRPVLGGYSIGPIYETKTQQDARSLRCLVRDNNNVYMLGNNHTLALLMNRKNNAIGLITGGSKSVTCSNDIRRVLNMLNVRLVTNLIFRE